jgi:hypothetical protein
VNSKKNPAAVSLGRLGGLARAKSLPASKLSEIGQKGAAARTKALTAEQRKRIAQKAIQVRWSKKR